MDASSAVRRVVLVWMMVALTVASMAAKMVAWTDATMVALLVVWKVVLMVAW